MGWCTRHTRRTAHRAPNDIAEDLFPEKRLMEPISEPIYDPADLAARHAEGPLSERFCFPEILQVLPPSAPPFSFPLSPSREPWSIWQASVTRHRFCACMIV